MNQKTLLIAKGIGYLLMSSVDAYCSAYSINKLIKYIKDDYDDDYDSFIKLTLGSVITGCFTGYTLVEFIKAIRYFKLIKTI